jgi:hypothetical protein
MALRGGQPTVLAGDQRFNFRLKTLVRYSEKMGRHLFPSPETEGAEKWVPAEAIGVKICSAHVPVANFTILSLEDTQNVVSVEPIDCGMATDLARESRAELYERLSTQIRGAVYFECVGGAAFTTVFIPCLDRIEFVRQRMTFLEALYRRTAIQRLRGPLEETVQALLRSYGSSSPFKCGRIST